MNLYRVEGFSPKVSWLRGCAACFISMCGAGSLYADFSFTLSESQAGLLLSGTGSVDIAGLTEIQTPEETPFTGGSIWPNYTYLAVGVGAVDFFDIGLPGDVTGPGVIGDGVDDLFSVIATSGQGDAFGFDNSFAALVVPEGYVSGAVLTGEGTYAGWSLADLGVETGQYSWETAGGTITLNVVPEWASSGLLLGGVAGLLCLSRRLSRRTR